MSEYPCLPPITDHAFARLVKKRCEDMSRSMAEIASELGCDVDDLCRWIMLYREPKARAPVDRTKYGPAISFSGPAVPSRSPDAKQFVAWRRQKEGAEATRRMLGAGRE